MKHQRKGEGDLVTDLLWQSYGRLLIAANSGALPCQPQHQKALSEHLNLSQKNSERLTPSGGVLGFSKLLWSLGVIFAFCILSFQVNADHSVTFSRSRRVKAFNSKPETQAGYLIVLRISIRSWVLPENGFLPIWRAERTSRRRSCRR